MLRIDLGCGAEKADGFLGLDRFPLPGVDLVSDLNEPLPFDTGSVDLIYASHSLEHVPNVIQTMGEIFRVLRHGGQLCIVAPYSEQKLNIANPYHVASFNEHTPRFWTSHPTAGVALVDYDHPHAQHWGIAESDHSESVMDFRLVSMEFFYFPEYLAFSDEERRALRRQRMDVCDQIMYHLIAWKPEEDTAEAYESLLNNFEPYVPTRVKARRAADAERATLVSMNRSSPSLVSRTQLEKESPQVANPIDGRLLTLMESLIAKLPTELDNAQKAVVEKRLAEEQRLSDLVRSLAETVDRLQDDEARVASLRAEIQVSDAICAEYREQNLELTAVINQSNSQYGTVSKNGIWGSHGGESQLAIIYDELTGYRESKAQRLASFVRRDRLWQKISPAFSDLKAYTENKIRKAGYRLALSGDLRRLDYREYRMPAAVDGMQLIKLAVSPIGNTTGTVGVEIVSPEGKILTQSMVSLSLVSNDNATVFRLTEPMSLRRGWYLRVFVRDASAPVAVYELSNPRIWRRHPIRRAFASVL